MSPDHLSPLPRGVCERKENLLGELFPAEILLEELLPGELLLQELLWDNSYLE